VQAHDAFPAMMTAESAAGAL